MPRRASSEDALAHFGLTWKDGIAPRAPIHTACTSEAVWFCLNCGAVLSYRDIQWRALTPDFTDERFARNYREWKLQE